MNSMVHVWNTVVFADGERGGNPCPVVLDASRLTPEQMQAIAKHFGHECGFVVSAVDAAMPSFRFFVPEHEMSMCVHATVALVALLRRSRRLQGPTATVSTSVGSLQVEIDGPDERPRVSVQQLPPTFSTVRETSVPDVCAVLRIRLDAMDEQLPVQSVSVSRPKLIVPLQNVGILDHLTPDFEAVRELCAAYETTGLYPFAVEGKNLAARQFPANSGYVEDAATGVAAGALAAYAARYVPGFSQDQWITIHQGQAMGKASVIEARTATVAGGAVAVVVRGDAQLLDEESIDLYNDVVVVAE